MKKRYWAAIIFFSVAAFMLIFSDNLTENQKMSVVDTKTVNEPDFYVEGFKAKSFKPSGKLDHIIQAQKAVHFPEGDYTNMDKPVVHFMRDDQSPIEITSTKGTLLNLEDKVIMKQNVSISPISGPQSFLVSTESLDILIDKEIAETDEYVHMQNPQSVMTSTGMKLYLKTQLMELQSNVRGQYDPKSVD